jgi:hypothetical protein
VTPLSIARFLRWFFVALGFRIAGHEEVRQRDGLIEVHVERLVDHLGVQ